MYVLDRPQRKSTAGRALLRAEYAAFAAKMEDLSGWRITVEGLKAAIDKVNR